MEEALTLQLIERDWPALLHQARVLGLGEPTRTGTRIDIPVIPVDSDDRFLAVLLCADYDAVAPLLDFADPEDPALTGRSYWPRMASAPINGVEIGARYVPIICTPGTLGYHIHSSHSAEVHPRETWRLPVVATLVYKFLRTMGPYTGRGV